MEILNTNKRSLNSSKSSDGYESESKCMRIPRSVRGQVSRRALDKGRRDRMNSCLDELITLMPPEYQRTNPRIQKVEIIEMAIKHIKNLTDNQAEETLNMAEQEHDLKGDDSRSFSSDAKSSSCELDMNNKPDGSSEVAMFKNRTTTKGFFEDSADASESSVEIFRNRRKILTKKSRKNHSRRLSRTSTSESSELCSSSGFYDESTDSREDVNTIMPGFVLHPTGSHYLPVSIDLSQIDHGCLAEENQQDYFGNYPITIDVAVKASSEQAG